MNTTNNETIYATIDKLFPKKKPINVEFLTEKSNASIELCTKGDQPQNTVRINIDNCYFRYEDLEELIQLLKQVQYKLEMNE